MQKPSNLERGGDEFYTPYEMAKRAVDDCKEWLDKYDLIYAPFNGEDKAIGKALREVYGDKVIFTPPSAYNQHMGYNDFFIATEYSLFGEGELYNKLRENKTIVFDNPPFSKIPQIIDRLSESKTDYILWGNAMNCARYIERQDGVHIMGRVFFDNNSSPVNACLFSNLFDDIKFIWGYGKDKKLEWNKKVNMAKYQGVFASCEVILICQRGYEFKVKDLRRYKEEDEQRFGGSVVFREKGRIE